MQICHLNVWIDISFIYSISDYKYIFKKSDDITWHKFALKMWHLHCMGNVIQMNVELSRYVLWINNGRKLIIGFKLSPVGAL